MGDDDDTTKSGTAGDVQLPAGTAGRELQRGDWLGASRRPDLRLSLLGRRVLGATRQVRRPELRPGVRANTRPGVIRHPRPNGSITTSTSRTCSSTWARSPVSWTGTTRASPPGLPT